MNIDLVQLNDGRLAIVVDTPLPGQVRRVEYYRDQALFMLIYNLHDHPGDLMHYELPPHVVVEVQKAGEIVIIDRTGTGHGQHDYAVPLIKIGF
ncbi:MAG: hypothetical protein V4621_01355 [Pseudomonadota bacterium]